MSSKQWKVFQPGTTVAWRESRIFGGRVHYGEVKSVQFAQNGYPITTVQFPTYREGQPREWAVEALATPDQYDDNPSFWAQ